MLLPELHYAKALDSSPRTPGTPLTVVESLSHPSPELEEYLKPSRSAVASRPAARSSSAGSRMGVPMCTPAWAPPWSGTWRRATVSIVNQAGAPNGRPRSPTTSQISGNSNFVIGVS